MKDLYILSRRTYYVASNQEMVKLIKTSILQFTMLGLTVEPIFFLGAYQENSGLFHGHITASQGGYSLKPLVIQTRRTILYH